MKISGHIWLVMFFAMTAIILASPTSSLAQEERDGKADPVRKHSAAVAIGHTQVSKGVQDGEKKWLALPSWALDYTFKWDDQWNIGLQNEIILSDFEVESGEEGQTLTRSSPISSIAIVGYRPIENLMLFAGGGGEFAKEENFAVVRLGVEPSMEIRERLELLLSFVYDFKIDGYNSFGLSFGIGYSF